MVKHIKGLLILVGLGISLFTALDIHAQTLAKHNWYFGNTQRSIRFNRVTNQPSLITNKATPFGTGGSAVATDRGNGNLLFYTDGKVIYDARHALMPGQAGGLTGTIASNSPAVITPVPKHPGKYFIFTNTANFTTGGAISYTVVDMTQFGSAPFPAPPFGKVETLNTLIPSLPGVSEGMITLPHDNGDDFWLITQNVNTLVFNATLINENSYLTGTFNTVASTAASFPTTTAAFGYHEGLKKLAAAPQDASTDALIMDFDQSSGILSFDRLILNSGVLSASNQAIYDIEWSQSGQYVYLSRHGDAVVPADVLQYDYQNSAITLRSILPSPVFRSYGLQRGPDNLIYHLYQSSAAGPFLLGRIDQPDSVASKTMYNAAPGVFAGLDFNGKQFPSFVPNDTIKINLDFEVAGQCQNSPTTFFPTKVTPGADSLQWTINDTLQSKWSPIYTYMKAGAYQVKLKAFYQGKVDSISKAVNINAFPLTLQLVEDTTACREEFPPPRGSSSPKQFSVKIKVQGGTPASIVWSNGDMGDILTPDSAGYYYAVVTDAGGCSAYKGVVVREYGTQTQLYNKWYFGNKAGIDFSKTPPKALSESAMNAPEGCAIVCDRNGQQIFYTDGKTVWNKAHTVIATDVGGNPAATESAIIIPVPGDETIYYIFTTQDFNGSDLMQLNYSMYDLKANAGLGAVIKSDVLMYVKNTERITAAGNWLLVHELGNATYRAYPITAEGIGNPVYTEIGSNHLADIPHNADGYMKLGPKNIVATPISTPGVSAKIELFQLDSAGTLNNFQTIDLNDPDGSVYGIEFSGSGRKLFASVRYTTGSSALYEYALDETTLAPTLVQKIPVAADLGAIQVGPNGQIYVAVNNAGSNTSLGTIQVVDDQNTPLATSTFTLNGFQLAAGTNSWLGLPNFAQIFSTPPQAPGITIKQLCSQDSTVFTGSGRDPNIEEYTFTVFNSGGQVVAQSNPNDKFNPEFKALLTPGNYKVTLLLQNRCDVPLQLSKDFTITAPPANPTRGVPLCNTPTVDLDANPGNVPGLTYRWTTGETTEVLTISEQGLYIVDITDAIGCKTRGQFIAADSRPIFDLGPDITICEDQNTPALNVGNAGMTYAWSVDGTPNGNTTAVQAVTTTSPVTVTYQVTVTDPVTGCFRTEDKVYNIKVSPLFNFAGTDPTSCGATDGSVTLDLVTSTPAGGPLYSYFIQGPGAAQDDLDQTAPNTYTVNNLGAGTFSAIVRDQISGCTISKTFGLSDATYTVTPNVPAPACDPPGVAVNVVTVGASLPLQWTATNSGTGTAVTGNSGAAAFPTTALPGGTYTIEVKDNLNCIKTADVTITPGARTVITLDPDLCALTLSASSTATNYTWTASPSTAIVGATTGATIQLAPNAGTVTYTVVSSGGPSCPGVETLTLDVGNIPTPTLSQSTGCAEFATVSVNPNGNFNYRWLVNGSTTPDPAYGGATIQLSTADNGKTFIVQIYEPQSGCTKDSDPLTAEVVGQVDAQLASTPPCDDGLPITLTATTTSPTGATYAWTRDGSALADVTTAQTQQNDEGTYAVKISKGTCNATASLVVDRAPLPMGDLPDRLVICDDPENTDPTTKQVELDPGVFVSYDWTKNGVSLGYTDQVLTADSKGDYQVEITDARGCKNKDKTDVANDCLPSVNGPNAFRPGSTSHYVDRHPELSNSDFWLLTRYIEDDQFKVFIFNRWGEMVFSSTDRYFKWNGGYNNDIGRPLPPGTYSYVVQYVSTFRLNEGVKEKRGGVALIR